MNKFFLLLIAFCTSNLFGMPTLNHLELDDTTTSMGIVTQYFNEIYEEQNRAYLLNLPDPAVSISDLEKNDIACGQDKLTVNLNVNNFLGRVTMPKGIKVNLYFETESNAPLVSTETDRDIPAGSSLNVPLTFNIPPANPIKLVAVVNLDDLSRPIYKELDPSNNTDRKSFTLNFQNDRPDAQDASLAVCSDGYDGIFDLNNATKDVTKGNTSYTVTYHRFSSEAYIGTDPISGLYAARSRRIFARVVGSGGSSCPTVVAVDLQVTRRPDANPDKYVLCSSKFEDTFDLGSRITLINNRTDVDVTFHEDVNDARGNGANPLPLLYTSGNKTIYARVIHRKSGCFNYNDVDLRIENEGAGRDFELFKCSDGTSNGTSAFDLNEASATMTNFNPAYSITYHATKDDALNNRDPLVSPYVTKSTTVYGRIGGGKCVGTPALKLTVESAPRADIATLIKCTNGQFVEFTLSNAIPQINSSPDVTITFHETEADAENDRTALPDAYTSGAKTIFARVVSKKSKCINVSKVRLVIQNGSSTGAPSAKLEACSTEKTAIFDLNEAKKKVTAGDTSLDVTYHSIPEDAENNLSPLPLQFDSANAPIKNGTTGDAIIFARITGGGCTLYSEITLIVIPQPVVNKDASIIACSNASIANFYLPSANKRVCADPDVEITYYRSLDDADKNDKFYALPENYNNSGEETIYARVDSKLNKCYDIAPVKLVIKKIAFFEEQVLKDCTSTPEGTFDLSSLDSYYKNGNTAIQVSYHTSFAGAESGSTDQVSSPFKSSTRTVYARVFDGDCVAIGEIKLEAILKPKAEEGSLNACTNKATEVFDLAKLNTQVTSVQNVDITYHANQKDADSNQNALPRFYETGATTIYARITERDTKCYSVVNVTLTIESNGIGKDHRMTACADEKGEATFKLTEANEFVSSGDTGATITYHPTRDDAVNNTKALPEVYTIQATETVFANIIGSNNQCSGIAEVSLIINDSPNVKISDFAVCEKSKNIGEFDLDSKIQAFEQENPGLVMKIFLTEDDSKADKNAQTGIITNTSNPQKMYVRLLDTQTKCFAYNSFELRATQGPNTTPGRIPLCSNNDEATFTLSNADSQIADTGQNIVTYHPTEQDAIDGTNQLPDTYTSKSKLVYARVRDIKQSCISTNILELVVFEKPAIQAVSTLEICNMDGSNVKEVDLTSKEEEILGYPPTDKPKEIFVFYYFTEEDAKSGNNPIVFPKNVNVDTPTKTFYYRIQNGSVDCFSQGSFDVKIVEKPNIKMEPVVRCEKSAGVAEFDIDAIISQFTITNPDFTITVYTSEENATSETDQLTGTYENTSNPQTLYARQLNTKLDCWNVVPFEIEAAAAPVAENITLSECSDQSQVEFNLEAAASKVTQEDKVTVTYFETKEKAEQDADQLTSPYLSEPKTIFAKTTNTATRCTTITEVKLEIIADIVINTVEPLKLCDSNGDGKETFDLTSAKVDIIGTNNPVTAEITYYLLEADANEPKNAITNPDTYESSDASTTIYYRIQNGNCFKVSSFDIQIVEGKSATVSNLESCGENDTAQFDIDAFIAEFKTANTDLELTVHKTSENATANENAITGTYENTSNPQIVFARIADTASGCVTIQEFNLIVNANVTANATSLAKCSSETTADFTLTDADENVTSDAGAVVTYHATQDEADKNENALTSPYNTASTTVFARVTSSDGNCFATSEVTITVNAGPTLNKVETISTCDENGDGSEIVDLTATKATIIGNNNDANALVTYYTTKADAEAKENAIDAPESFTANQSPTTVHFRIEDPNSSNCFSVGEFNIEFGSSPSLPITQFTQPLCGANGVATGNVETYINQIKAIDATLNVSFHTTKEDAEKNENAISGEFTTTSNPQIIYARVTSDTATCPTYVEVTLTVNEKPTAVGTEIIEKSNASPADFDLSEADNNVTTDTDATITYHATKEDAEQGINPLDSPYNSEPTTVFARVTKGDCFAISNVVLKLENCAISLNTVNDLTSCTVDTNGNAIFNLTDTKTDILGTNNPQDAVISYYKTQEDATNSSNFIEEPIKFETNQPQTTIFFRVQDINTSTCSVIGQFNLVIGTTPTLPTNNVPQTVCGENGVATVNVDEYINQIKAIDASYEVSFHITKDDAEKNENAITGDFTTTSNPQSIYARVTSNGANCPAYVEVTVNVVDSPNAVDTELTSTGTTSPADFTLTDADSKVTSDTNVTVTYHETEEQANSGDAALSSPYSSEPKVIYARVTNGDCYSVSKVTLRIPDPTCSINLNTVDNLPPVCDENGDGSETFDLTVTKATIVGSNNPTDAVVTYHTSKEDADNSANAIATPESFNATQNQTTVFFRIQDANDATCFRTDQFNVEFITKPNAVDAELVSTETSSPTDFTLTDADSKVTSDTGVTITYHETEDDANSGDAPLSSPYNSEPKVIYARVANGSCYSVSQVTLKLADPTCSINLNTVSSLPPVCDENGDGSEVYNLTTTKSTIVGDNNPTDVTLVTYHTSQKDAENGANPIETPDSYTLTQATTVIFFRIQYKDDTSCSANSYFEIQLNSIEKPQQPITAEECSVNGSATFDLTALIPTIAGGNANTTVDFFETEENATKNESAIQTINAYSISQNEMIYARINTQTCHTIVPVSLTISEGVSVSTKTRKECATDGDQAEFSLTSLITELQGGNSGTKVSLHTSEDNAKNDVDAIDTSSAYKTATTTIYSRVDNGSCIATGKVELTVTEAPKAVAQPYIACSDTNKATFKLETLIDKIRDNVATSSVYFYSTEELANKGQQADRLSVTSYEAETSTIYARVENDASCASIVPIELKVISSPTIKNLELTTCQRNGKTEFDLGAYEIALKQDNAGYSFEAYKTKDAAENQKDALADIYTSDKKNSKIYMRISVDGGDCYAIEPVKLIVNAIPTRNLGKKLICTGTTYTLPNGDELDKTQYYTNTYFDANTNCDAKVTLFLIVGDILFPNAFSPNGDGNNDVFRPIPMAECSGIVTDFKFIIYNRWGQKVFETNQFTEGWSGTVNGKQGNIGGYTYFSEYEITLPSGEKERKQDKGIINLLP